MKNATIRRRHVTHALAIAAVVGLASTGRSATIVWTGLGDATTWGSGANWPSSTVPATGADVQFVAPAAGNVYNSTTAATIDATGTFSLDSIKIGGTTTGVSTPPLTINNGTLTLTSANATAASSTPTAIWVGSKQTNAVAVNSNVVLAPSTGKTSTFAVQAQTATFGGVISDGGAGVTLAVTGAGNTDLAGQSTFTGGTSVSSTGTLQLGASSTISGGIIASGPAGKGILTLASGATLQDDGVARTVANAVSLGGTVNFAGSAGATVDGTGLTAPTGVSLTSATIAHVNPAAASLTINSSVGDSGSGYSLTKTGAGTLTLNGANTYSGGTYVSAGTLAINGANTYSAGTFLSGGTLKLSGASTITSGNLVSGPLGTGTLTLSGGTLTDNAAALTIPNAVSVSGTVTLGASTGSITFDGAGLTSPNGFTLTGSTTLTTGDTTTIKTVISDGGNGYSLIKTGASNLVLSGSNTYTGTTTAEQANIQVSANALSGQAGPLGNATSTVQLGDASTPKNANVGLVTTGAYTVGRNLLVYNISANSGYTGGSVVIGGATGQTTTSVYTGQITLNGSANLQSYTTGSNVVDFQGQFTGVGGINKVNTGAVQLDNASNNYTGGTTVSNGTLTVAGSGVLGASTGTLTVSNTNTTAAGNASILNLSTSAPTTVGSLSGTIATTTGGGTNTATINNGGQLLTVNQTTPGSYAGVIAGVGGFSLGNSSTSTLTLTGTSTYSGATTVTAGTLIVAGASTGGGAVAVNSGGTLGGTGSITTGSGASGLTVASGATVAPGLTASGATSGTGLTVNGDTTINGTLSVQADTNTSQLITTGALTIGSGAAIAFTGASALSAPAYVIATYGSPGESGTFATVSNEPSGYTINYDYNSDNEVALVASSGVPEPASVGLIGISAVGLLAKRRRRRQPRQ